VAQYQCVVEYITFASITICPDFILSIFAEGFEVAYLEFIAAFGTKNGRLALVGLIALGVAAASLPAFAQKAPGYQMPDYQKAYLKKKWDSRPLSQKIKTTAEADLTTVPPGFPIPVYPGKFMHGVERHNGIGKFIDLRIQSDGKPATVNNWYLQALKSGGWQIDQKMPKKLGRYGTISGYKEGRTARVSVAANSKGGCDVSVSLVQHE
jgi:hypothetical protein